MLNSFARSLEECGFAVGVFSSSLSWMWQDADKGSLTWGRQGLGARRLGYVNANHSSRVRLPSVRRHRPTTYARPTAWRLGDRSGAPPSPSATADGGKIDVTRLLVALCGEAWARPRS